MDKTVTVTEVSDYTKEWSGKYGPMVSYYVKVNDLIGVVDINKKPDSPAPKVGEQLTGTFTKSDFVDRGGNEHYRFKAAPKAFGGSSVDLSPVLTKLDEIIALVKKLPTAPQNGSQSKVDEVFDVSDEPFDLSDIPF